MEFAPGQYRLYLHTNSGAILVTASIFTVDEFDAIVHRASQDLALRVTPFQYASYLFFEQKTDDLKLRELLMGIMATSSPDDESVARAHNMMGNILAYRGDIAHARAVFERANTVAERAGISDFDVAYLNLANLDLIGAASIQFAGARSLLIHEARDYAAMALARNPLNGDTYVVLGRICELEGFDASAQEDYDTAISMPRQSYTASAYWYRANLEFKTGHYYRAAEDQTEYLYFTQNENQNIKGIATQYLRLHNFLLQTIRSEAARTQETRINIPASDIIATTNAWGLHLDTLDYGRVPDQTQGTEAAVLQAGCDALRMVVRLWNQGDTDGVNFLTVIADPADVAKRQRSAPNAPPLPCTLQKVVPIEPQRIARLGPVHELSLRTCDIGLMV